MSAPAPSAVLPTRLGRYEVEALLGRGAMGAVYRARDPSLERTVAVKTVNTALLETAELREEYLERFQREAQAAARLSHPNIVAVHDLGVDEETGAPFIVMEHVPGVSLATLLREHPQLPAAQAVEIVEQVAAALEEAHRHGIVHRDVKPANVFVDPRGRVKVGDFGIARIEGSELTQSGVTLGTPGYLAPEVVRGAPADARSDVFALGVLAYTLLAGRRPFPGVTPQALVAEVLEREPETPHAVRAEVPEAASAVVMRAIEKSPEARTQTVETFRRELMATTAMAEATERVPTAAAASAAASAAPATMTVATQPPRGRRPARVLWLAGGAAALLLVSWLAWLSRGDARDEAGRVPASPVAPSAVARTPRPPDRPDRTTSTPQPRLEAPPATRGGSGAVRSVPPGQAKAGKPGKARGRGHAKGRKKD